MSKGGGNQTTTNTASPWAPVQPLARDAISLARGALQDPPDFYRGQTYVGALPEEQAAFDQGRNFLQSSFGGNPQGPAYSDLVSANQQLLSGGPTGELANRTGDVFARNVLGSFGGGHRSLIGEHQVDKTAFNPSAFNPNVVNADPNAALNSQLSGQADFSGIQGATMAAARPMLDALTQDILPGLRAGTNAMTNPTGEIKEQNRIIPQVLRNVGDIGAGLAWQEQQRAKNAQLQAANLATQGGLQQFGLGLQGAGMSSDLNQSRNLANAQLGLQGDIARQGARDAYRGDVLGLGSLAAGFGGQSMDAMSRGASMFPGILQTGMMPSQHQAQYGDFQRGLAEAGLTDDMNRFNYNQRQGMDMAQWAAGLAGGMGGMGGTQTGSQPIYRNNAMGALGGASATAGLLGQLGQLGVGVAAPWMLPLTIGGGMMGAFA